MAISALRKNIVTKLVAVFFLSLICLDASAQANVRDSSPISASSPSAVAVPGAVQQPTVDYSVINQIQQLQQEILELRGLVEEQSFEIKRLKQQRLDDYLDLDKRISELSKSQDSSANSDSTSSRPDTSGISSLSNPVLPTASAKKNDEEEKALYRKAIDQLLSKQDFTGAQTSFNQYLSDYPSGTYVPNVHYWQGQIFLTDSKKKAAEQSFLALIENYPDHQKVPDAKYKLATIYYDQGKKSEAKALLEEVSSGNSDASRLAKAFLANRYK